MCSAVLFLMEEQNLFQCIIHQQICNASALWSSSGQSLLWAVPIFSLVTIILLWLLWEGHVHQGTGVQSISEWSWGICYCYTMKFVWYAYYVSIVMCWLVNLWASVWLAELKGMRRPSGGVYLQYFTIRECKMCVHWLVCSVLGICGLLSYAIILWSGFQDYEVV